MVSYRVRLFYVFIPLAIVIARHIDFGISSKVKVQGLIPVILIVSIIVFLSIRKKSQIMRIRWSKEVEDGFRTLDTVKYYQRKGFVLFVIALLFLKFVQFNFNELFITSAYIGVSLFFGAWLDRNIVMKDNIKKTL